jgi:hypothetical protein
MTYMAVCRSLALQESMALRCFARQQRLPRTVPVDYWREWERTQRVNAGCFKAAREKAA